MLFKVMSHASLQNNPVQLDECWDFSLVAPREFPILEVDLFKLAIIKGGSELAYLSTVEVI